MSYGSLREFLKPSEVDDILPNGTVIFVGINLIKEDGKWVQKGAFAKVQNMGKSYAYSTKKKVTTESQMADDLMSSNIITENSEF